MNEEIQEFPATSPIGKTLRRIIDHTSNGRNTIFLQLTLVDLNAESNPGSAELQIHIAPGGTYDVTDGFGLLRVQILNSENDYVDFCIDTKITVGSQISGPHSVKVAKVTNHPPHNENFIQNIKIDDFQ